MKKRLWLNDKGGDVPFKSFPYYGKLIVGFNPFWGWAYVNIRWLVHLVAKLNCLPWTKKRNLRIEEMLAFKLSKMMKRDADEVSRSGEYGTEFRDYVVNHTGISDRAIHLASKMAGEE